MDKKSSSWKDQHVLVDLTAKIVASYVAKNRVRMESVEEVIGAVYASLAKVDLKMLKRHLRTSYGLTPEQYRAKWRLPPDYPMASPNYTLSRSEFAKKSGFGTKKVRNWNRAKMAAE
jgi:predicted transcriptional regulator